MPAQPGYYGGYSQPNDARTLYIKTQEGMHSITYYQNGRYDPVGLKLLDHVMRDWRDGVVRPHGEKAYDLLHAMQKYLGGSIQINSATRTQATQQKLKAMGYPAATVGHHVTDSAFDFGGHGPGPLLAALRKARTDIGGLGMKEILFHGGHLHISPDARLRGPDYHQDSGFAAQFMRSGKNIAYNGSAGAMPGVQTAAREGRGQSDAPRQRLSHGTGFDAYV